MFNYDPIVEAASTLIAQFGKVCPARRTHPVTRVNGVESRPPAEAFSVTGVLVTWRPYENALVVAGDMKFISTSEAPVKIGDIITINGEEWRVEQPNPVQPADTLIVYKMQLRRL